MTNLPDFDDYLIRLAEEHMQKRMPEEKDMQASDFIEAYDEDTE